MYLNSGTPRNELSSSVPRTRAVPTWDVLVRGTTQDHDVQVPPLDRLADRVQISYVGIGGVEVLQELHHFVVVVVLEQVRVARDETVLVERRFGSVKHYFIVIWKNSRFPCVLFGAVSWVLSGVVVLSEFLAEKHNLKVEKSFIRDTMIHCQDV
jgi:hypothetical protein